MYVYELSLGEEPQREGEPPPPQPLSKANGKHPNTALVSEEPE